MSVNEDDIDDDRGGAFDEYEGEECPVCGNSDCETHMVVIFVDGYPHDDFGALTHNDWNEIAQSLQVRLVEAWIEGRHQVTGPSKLLSLVPTLDDSERREIMREISGEETPNDPGSYVYEVCELLDARGDLPDVEGVEDVMREALESLRGMVDQTNSFDKGPCTFVSNSIYASNPEAMVRRFKMVFGL